MATDPFPVVAPQLTLVRARDLDGLPIPERKWLVRNRIPRGTVSLLTGDGAIGKTTIMLQLGVATDRGTDWLGAAVEDGGPALIFSAEEDQDEMHRRLSATVEHLGIAFRDLEQLRLLCMPGEDTVLGALGKDGTVQPTRLFGRLEAEACDLRVALVAIEAAADVFAGNENDRGQVRQFITLLRRLAIRSGAAVLLLAHPSLSGLNSGSGTSGSTHWNNSVRSRLYFTTAKTRTGDEPDADVRELKVMKSNYGPAGETVRLRWQRGVFVPEGSGGSLQQVAAEAAVDQAYLDCLDGATGQGRQVGPNKSITYAPKVFEAMPQASGHRARALAAAQERLFAAGRIETRTSGPPSKRREHIARKILSSSSGLADAAE